MLRIEENQLKQAQMIIPWDLKQILK